MTCIWNHDSNPFPHLVKLGYLSGARVDHRARCVARRSGFRIGNRTIVQLAALSDRRLSFTGEKEDVMGPFPQLPNLCTKEPPKILLDGEHPWKSNSKLYSIPFVKMASVSLCSCSGVRFHSTLYSAMLQERTSRWQVMLKSQNRCN